MGFNESLLVRRRDELHDKGVRVRFIGRRDWRVPRRVLRRIDEAVELTRHNRRMTLTMAFNYGGRAEIIDAVRAMVAAGTPADKITEKRAAPAPVRPRDARSRPGGAHVGRVPHLELPALGAGLQRAGLHRRAVARLPPRAPVRRRARVPGPRPPLRRACRRAGRREAAACRSTTTVAWCCARTSWARPTASSSFLTRGHGKVRAVAKGVRKTKSRFGGRLEPPSHVDLLLYEGAASSTSCSQAETVDHFRPLRDDLDRLGRAVSMLEAADQLALEREPNPQLYDMLVGALRHAGAAGRPAGGAGLLPQGAGAGGLPARRSRRAWPAAARGRWCRGRSRRGACAAPPTARARR